MVSGDLQQELGRRNALWIAGQLANGAPDVGHPDVSTELRVRTGAVVLSSWSTDAEVRAALRPVFEAAVPDQRALIALGDIDTWLPHGRIARSWWIRAAAGPDPELAALGAWRAAQADLRGGRDDDAGPLLQQADAAGIEGASLALGRIVEKRGDDEAAARLFRRSRSDEGMLRLAEILLRADDVDGADDVVAHCSPMPHTPGSVDLCVWSDWVRGEIAFRRGFLDAAEVLLERSRHAPGRRGRQAELRLAQIAVAQGDASSAHFWTTMVAGGSDLEADHARLLLELHRDLIEEGARLLEQDD